MVSTGSIEFEKKKTFESYLFNVDAEHFFFLLAEHRSILYIQCVYIKLDNTNRLCTQFISLSFFIFILSKSFLNV